LRFELPAISSDRGRSQMPEVEPVLLARFLFPHQLLHTAEFQMGSFNQGHHVLSRAACHCVIPTRKKAVVPVAARYKYSANSGEVVVARSNHQRGLAVLRFEDIVSISAH